MRPFKNESPYNFGMRCPDYSNLIILKLNFLKLHDNERAIRFLNYDDLELKTYKRGLPLLNQTNVRLGETDSLEKAYSLVTEDEHFLYFTEKSNINLNSTFNPNLRIKPAINLIYSAYLTFTQILEI